MGRTLTCYLLTNYGNLTGTNSIPVAFEDGTGAVITEPNEFPVHVVITGQIQRVASGSATTTILLTTYDRPVTYALTTTTVNGSSSSVTYLNETNQTWNTFVGSDLCGVPLRMGVEQDASYRHNNKWTVTIDTHYRINPVYGITVTEHDLTFDALQWIAPNANDGTISQYQIQKRDRASSTAAWGEWADASTTTNTSITISANTTGQRQYRIRAVGTNTAYNSDWSESPIIKHVFLSSVSQDSKILATLGNAYHANSIVVGTTTLDDAWYNQL